MMENKNQLLRNRLSNNNAILHSNSALNASRNITRDLLYAVEMTDTQINQGHAALASLDQSSSTLGKTGEKYDSVKDKLAASKRITKRMSRKDELDRYIFYAGFSILLLTVCYLIWKRLWVPFM